MFKKRLITISALPFVTALLLGSSLIISNKPEKVSAINDTHEHDDWTGVTELPSSAGNYYLTNNITLSATWTVPEGTTNLCLNGYVINANGENYSVITIGEATTLNLYDCGDTSHNGYVDSNGLWHLGEGEGTAKTLTGGIITGGIFEQTGKAGGGVYVGKGEFNMYGGTITGNEATTNGGGVFVASGGKFTMSAGEIKFNKANNGGGVATQSGTIEMNGGMITDNNATNGGGIFSYSGSTTITGGSICNNIATTVAGGVYQYGNLTLCGAAQVVGNTANGEPNNFFQPKGKLISFDTDITPSEDMKIGLTLQDGTGQFTSDGVEDYSSNFFSDKLEYGVKYNSETPGSEHLELVDAYTITNNTKETDIATNHGYIEVKETAIKNEIVSVTIYPNQGYKLSSLVFNDGTQDQNITSTKSFKMPGGAVSITATFEEKGEQIVTIVLDEKFIYPNKPYITEKHTYSTSNYYEKLGDGVVTVEYKPKGADDSEYTTEVPTEYGEYTLRVSVAEGSEYQAGFATKDFIYSPQIITQVGFGNLQQPVAGAVVPEKTGGMLVNTKYSETLTWYPEITTVNEDGKKIFDCNTTYTATVTLTIKDSFTDNYVFTDKPTLKGAGSGWVLSEDSNDKTLIYTKEFEPTADHSVNKINGTNATCTEDGFEDAYQCETCGLYYEDEACSELIGNEAAYNDWILGDGKIPALGHEMTHHEAVAPTCTQDGNVEYWTCSHESGVYYANEQGTETLSTIVDPKTGHDMTHHPAVAPTCTEDGTVEYWTCSHESGVYYANEQGTSTLISIVDPKLNHSRTEVAGKSPTCTEDGYMVAYKCVNCEIYFSDPAGEHEIGDETAYNAWKLNEGKIQARHVVSKVSGVDPTKERSGYKEAWKCSECGQYFEDEACTILIGDETAYNAWKSARGYLPQLPSEGLSAGAIAGICVGSIFLFLLVIYLIGYFFLYRKGKLDEKKIKAIYKFLPRGEKNLKEDDK